MMARRMHRSRNRSAFPDDNKAQAHMQSAPGSLRFGTSGGSFGRVRLPRIGAIQERTKRALGLIAMITLQHEMTYQLKVTGPLTATEGSPVGVCG